MKRTAKWDEVVAYHEAGHLVAARDQGVTIHRVSIEPAEDSAGRVHHAPIMGRFNLEDDVSPQVRIRGERLIRICLAGPIAQRQFNPRSWRHYAEADYEKAADMILRLATPGEHAETYIRLLMIEARQIVDYYWDMIGALATELIKRREMSGRAVAAFTDQFQAGGL
jgi:hypothetical protein